MSSAAEDFVLKLIGRRKVGTEEQIKQRIEEEHKRLAEGFEKEDGLPCNIASMRAWSVIFKKLS